MMATKAKLARIRTMRRVHKPNGWFAQGVWSWRPFSQNSSGF